jgi:hypothetical protein
MSKNAIPKFIKNYKKGSQGSGDIDKKGNRTLPTLAPLLRGVYPARSAVDLGSKKRRQK